MNQPGELAASDSGEDASDASDGGRNVLGNVTTQPVTPPPMPKPKEEDRKPGKWQEFFSPLWNSDEEQAGTPTQAVRLAIFLKTLQLVDKHCRCKDSIGSFELGLVCWQNEFKLIVPPEFEEYCPTS